MRATGFAWPDRYRMAVALTWDVSGEATVYGECPQRARTWLSDLHQHAYGPRRGIYHVLDLLERYGIPATFFVPLYTIETYPEVIAAMAGSGHELALHGQAHEGPAPLTEDRVADLVRRGQSALVRLGGVEAAGYRAPARALERFAPGVLLRNGIGYDSSLMDDEVPYALRDAAGDLIELPVHWVLDDLPYWGCAHRGVGGAIAEPDHVLRSWVGEFEGFWAIGGLYILTLHPSVSGRPGHMTVVERLVRHIGGFPGVWWTTLRAVFEHARALHLQGRISVIPPLGPAPAPWPLLPPG